MVTYFLFIYFNNATFYRTIYRKNVHIYTINLSIIISFQWKCWIIFFFSSHLVLNLSHKNYLILILSHFYWPCQVTHKKKVFCITKSILMYILPHQFACIFRYILYSCTTILQTSHEYSNFCLFRSMLIDVYQQLIPCKSKINSVENFSL